MREIYIINKISFFFEIYVFKYDLYLDFSGICVFFIFGIQIFLEIANYQFLVYKSRFFRIL